MKLLIALVILASVALVAEGQGLFALYNHSKNLFPRSLASYSIANGFFYKYRFLRRLFQLQIGLQMSSRSVCEGKEAKAGM